MKPIQPICTLRSFFSYIVLSVLFTTPLFLSGQITLSSQAQVDTFSQTEVIGDLTISGPDITNLDGLSSLSSISEGLIIKNNGSLINLNGLSGITSLRFLSIGDNPLLINLEGLTSLHTVHDRMNIFRNEALINFQGLSALSSVKGKLFIFQNNALINLQGLSALTILGELQITDNAILTSLNGLDALSSVVGDVFYFGNIIIFQNPSLSNLGGLTALSYVRGNLIIYDNDALINLNLSLTLDSLRGIEISDNDALINLNGLSNISWLSTLSIRDNASLINFEGLSALNSVISCNISNNASLTSLDGFEGITSIERILDIRNNPVLQNLDGLSNLTSSGNRLYIRDNTSLTSFCGLFSLFDGGMYSTVTISGNAVNPTISEIIANGACVSITCPSDATFFTDIGVCCATINLVPPTVQGGNSTTTLVNDYNNTSDASDTYFVTTTVVTWTATDAYGNQSSCAQNITVMDNEAPQFGVPDPSCSMYQSCYDALTLGLSNNETIYQQALAACNGDSVCIRAADRAKVVELEEIRKIFRGCLEGNTNCSLVPISGALPDLIVSGSGENCEAQVDNPGPVVAENCAAFILTNDYSSATNALGSGIYPEGTTTVTWTATDQFGNVSMITRNIIVTTEECIIDPIEFIDDLVAAGLITQGQANALLKKLEKCNLNAFENQVNALVNNGTLTEEQADTLIAAAIAHCSQLKSGTIGNRSSDISFNLGQNYPNPFSTYTTIPFTLSSASHVNLKLYNTNGKVVKNILEEHLQIGNYEVKVNMQMLSAGVYFYRIETGGDTQTLILIKE